MIVQQVSYDKAKDQLGPTGKKRNSSSHQHNGHLEDTKSNKGTQGGEESRTKESQDAISSVARINPLVVGPDGAPRTPQIRTHNNIQRNNIDDQLLSMSHQPNQSNMHLKIDLTEEYRQSSSQMFGF